MTPPADSEETAELKARIARLETALAEGGRGGVSKVVDKGLRLLPVFAISNVAVALPAVLISIGVAYFTFVQAEATQKMQIASVWPRMAYDTGNLTEQGEPQISLEVGNQGVGPAVIEGLQVSYDGKAYENGDSLVRACCAQGKDSLSLVSSNVYGTVIRPGDTVKFLRLNGKDADPEVFSRLDRERFKFRVKLCYCSVFDDCWITDSLEFDVEPVKQCPADWVQYGIPRTTRVAR